MGEGYIPPCQRCGELLVEEYREFLRSPVDGSSGELTFAEWQFDPLCSWCSHMLGRALREETR
jgi:hypothetical protein